MDASHPLRVAVNGWMAGRLASGSGQYLAHLLDWLPRATPPVKIALLLPAHHSMANAGVAESRRRWPQIDVVSVSLPPLPENLAKVWWEQVAAPRAAHRLGADVYFVPYWAPPAWSPLPVVTTIHDLIPLLLPAYRGGLLQRLYTHLVSRTARGATAILTVSEAAARDIIAYLQVEPARVRVVHHGPNQEGFATLDAAHLQRVRVRYALPERFFLYIGGFDVRKNVQAVVKGYARFRARGGDPTIKLVLAGALPTQDTPFFPDPRRLAQEAGCAADVHFCGWIEEEDKPALYALATAFIFPSLYEGFGMMILEAMQAGTPVVTSKA
ncbi:MAG: glycosyltransferase family 4 protein [Caldilinea sp.]|nr:glycosyltransferase family 4 protein [Caldilinea sp.]MDW8442362.1 glycosyltransferase family 1 protein [Caldilineaceae bacterium]